jgi:nitrous oxidase accessory protein
MGGLRPALGIALCALLPLSAPAGAKDVQVHPEADGLRQAVAAARPGDRLVVKPGSYSGPIVIDKPLVIEAAPGTLVKNGGTGTVLKVVAPDVTVRGLTLRGSGARGEKFDSGIYVEKGADRPVIEDNHVEGNLFGIVLHGCRDAVVRNNDIANRNDLWLNDRGNGIHVWDNSGSLIEGNRVRGGRDGIFIEVSHGNIIRGNRFEALRFAVHYMYANRNEVADNISIRNHVGYAIMYSDHIRVLRNVSVSDLEHGLMLHTTHHSEVAENYIYGTGEKCLFVYTSAVDEIHDNRLEACGIGVHFTGGSERNVFYGNSFVGNETQVKYTGLRLYEWSKNGRGNYWSDNAAFDLNGDGIADTAYRPNTLVDWVLWKYPLVKLLLSSPAMETLRYVQQQFPTLYPGGAIDSFPLMTPAPVPVALPMGVDLTPAPRDPAQEGSVLRSMM